MRKSLLLACLLLTLGCYSIQRQVAHVRAGRLYYLKTSVVAVEYVFGQPDEIRPVRVDVRRRYGVARSYPGLRYFYHEHDKYFDFVKNRYVRHGLISELQGERLPEVFKRPEPYRSPRR